MALKNDYLAIIYKGCIKQEPVKKIHKALYDATINKKRVKPDKYLLAMMIKMANKAKKISAESSGLLAVAIFELFKRTEINDKAKKVINHNTMEQAEKEKQDLIDNFIDENRANGKWFYLASSHNDCAKDHKDWQGKLYVDSQAPQDVINYAKDRALYTVQWVMSSPVWFITRPNCRHYFVALTEKEVRKKSIKRLKRKYKTHKREGDRDLQTPKRIAIEEYEDRLRMLKELYHEYPTQKLKDEILKTEMLLKKWKNSV